MNVDKLKSIISKKAKGDNTISAQLYQMFFFERILSRISKSEYKDNIILKGGLLLSSIIGENMRTTKDMDATLKSIPLEKENVVSIMTKILNIDINDKYFNDKEVIDCQLTLYLLLLTKEGEEQDRMFKEFEDKYNRLSKEKKEYIREDLKKLFEVKEKNNEEKEKRL